MTKLRKQLAGAALRFVVAAAVSAIISLLLYRRADREILSRL